MNPIPEGVKPGSVSMAEIRAAYPALALVAEGTLRLPPLDPETAEWVDGPWFVKWLYGHGMSSTKQFGPSIERRIQEWRRGGAASLNVVDQILTALDLSLSDLPDEMWVRPPNRGGHGTKMPESLRNEAAARYRAGEQATDLAVEYDISPDSIRKWGKS